MDCCVVKGCNNKKDQGAFVGDICSACYTMITTGDASIRSTNFINKLKTITESKTEPKLDDFIKWVEKLVYKYGVELDIYAWGKIKEKLMGEI